MTQPNNIVLADGCFDPLHVGHIAYLEAAAKLGTLIVQVASDEAIAAKGRESFQTRTERAKTVEALKIVVLTVQKDSLADAVRAVCPNVLAKGRDWIGRLPEDVVAACREVGTVIVYTDTQERTSSERLLMRSVRGHQALIDTNLVEDFECNIQQQIRDEYRQWLSAKKCGAGVKGCDCTERWKNPMDPKFKRGAYWGYDSGDPGDENDAQPRTRKGVDIP